MRFTKGMKKALSFALSAALVLTSAAIAPNTSKAAAGDALATPFTVTVAGSGWNGPSVAPATNGTITVDKTGTYTVEGIAETDSADIFKSGALVLQTNIEETNTEYKTAYDFIPKTITVNETEYKWDSIGAAFEGGLRLGLYNPWNTQQTASNSVAVPVTAGDTVKFTFDVDMTDEMKEAIKQQLAKEAAIEEEMTAKAESYVDGNMNAFKVYGVYCDTGYKVSDWGTPASAMSITKDGTYEVKMATASGDFKDINSLWLETNIYKTTKVNDNFSITVDKLTVGSTDYTPLNEQKEVEAAEGTRYPGKMVYTAQNARYVDGFESIMVDCEAAGGQVDLKNYLDSYRVNLCNGYNAATKTPKDVNGVPSFVNPDCTADNAGYSMDAFYNKPISGKTGDKMVLTITVKGMGTTTTSTTPSGAATKSIKAAKKSVVVAAGKSTTVAYTVTKAATAAKAAGVTVSSANTKVAKASISGGKIKITVPKKATKGASTTVTVKSGSASAKIKVTVKNPIKKISAKKKASIKKKGKTAKITVKLTATNKKKATTDKITVKSSKKNVVKVTKIGKASKSKVVITVKGVKKGTSTVTIKVGSKKVKVKVTVKK